jgi:hypothetical protein
VGRKRQAEVEEQCGVSLKGRCGVHGVVREDRASGRTSWRAGCNTDTSDKYLHTAFPVGVYTVLRIQRHLGLAVRDKTARDPEVPEGLHATIAAEYEGTTSHFRHVQRRFPDRCLAWHFAVGEESSEVWVELQVLVRHGEGFDRALAELTGITRQAPSFQPTAVIRSDYPQEERDQLRRDWAALLRCALLRIGQPW